jgi:MAST domain-containing protein
LEIISGPCKEINEYVGQNIGQNETISYEWEVVPTDNWAGGSIPLDFVYQFDELGAGGDIIAKGRFTAAYITVTEEYYNGESVKVSEPEASDRPATASGFMVPITVCMLLLAGVCRRRI